MAPKRSNLMPRNEIERDGERFPVSLTGTCRVGERAPQEVQVLDLGPLGCSLQGLPVGVTKTEPLMLNLGAGGAISARLKWARKGVAGLSFDAPLDQAALEQLSAPA
jgi:hypothetical protein